ncbi:MAG: hypothetical protein J7L77_07485 [Clostridiales bacterium]|nr:hypothetical protein [Clostridiales bacterium]
MKALIKTRFKIVIILVVLLISVQCQKKKKIETVYLDRPDNEVAAELISYYDKIILSMSEMVGCKLDSTVFCASADYAEFLQTVKNKGEKPVVLFRYSDSFCSSCVEHELLNILTMADQVTICVLGSIKDISTKRIFRKQYFKNCKYYEVQKNLSLPAENLNTPYYFILNAKLEIKQSLVSDLHNPTLSQKWIKNHL